MDDAVQIRPARGTTGPVLWTSCARLKDLGICFRKPLRAFFGGSTNSSVAGNGDHAEGKLRYARGNLGGAENATSAAQGATPGTPSSNRGRWATAGHADFEGGFGEPRSRKAGAWVTLSNLGDRRTGGVSSQEVSGGSSGSVSGSEQRTAGEQSQAGAARNREGPLQLILGGGLLHMFPCRPRKSSQRHSVRRLSAIDAGVLTESPRLPITTPLSAGSGDDHLGRPAAPSHDTPRPSSRPSGFDLKAQIPLIA